MCNLCRCNMASKSHNWTKIVLVADYFCKPLQTLEKCACYKGFGLVITIVS